MAAALVAGQAPAQSSSTQVSETHSKTTTHTKSRHKESATEIQLREMREQMKAQQDQIDALKQQLSAKDQQVNDTQQAATAAQTQAAAATQAAQQAQATAQESSSKEQALESTVADVKTTTASVQESVVKNQADVEKEIGSPAAIHYKGVTITPVGYLAAESVVRTRSMNSDINTPFNSTPYQNSGQAYTSEFNGSGRQSRIGAKVTGEAPFGKMTGYYEADFLGAGITSNNNQSNSYVLRQRQVWGQVALHSGFTFTGGQMWSMVTETKHAVDASTENLPQTIDAQYHVGFSWERQYGVRFAQAFANNKLTAAMSLEEPQIVNYTSSTTPPDFFVGNIGTGGGLYNLSNKYSNNVAPDVVVKVTADPGVGHYELGGIARFFRSRIYPNQTSTSTSSAGAYNNTVTGGGVFLNARFPVTKFMDLGLHFMGGDGVNRYGTSQLADVTVHPDGSLEPLRGAQGLFSIETHPTKKLDIFGYAGTEYAQRTYYVNGTTITGYAPPTLNTSSCYTEQATVAPSTGSTGGVFGGAPYDPSSSCGAQTRDITEGTLGFTYRFYNSPERGRIQYSMTYSYLEKTGWVGTAGAPHATNNMIFTGFRYYIP